MNVISNDRVQVTTPENVVVSHFYTGYQTLHGESLLGDVAVVYAQDNNGAFTFLPPRIHVDGELYVLTAASLAERLKLYFRPFRDEDNGPTLNDILDQDKPFDEASVAVVDSCRLTPAQEAVVQQGLLLLLDALYPYETPRLAPQS